MNNKGVDQTARMRRMVCEFVVCKPPKTGFLVLRPKCQSLLSPKLKEMSQHLSSIVIVISTLRVNLFQQNKGLTFCMLGNFVCCCVVC